MKKPAKDDTRWAQSDDIKQSFAEAVYLDPDMDMEHKVDWLWLSYRHIDRQRKRLHEALAFAKSVILGGEQMSPQAEQIIYGALRQDDDVVMRIPKVVCLCGSSRFYREFTQANFDETQKGRIVLTVAFWPQADDKESHNETFGVTPEQKEALDNLHLRKIDLCDEILVINPGGYIGASTRREIEYAMQLGKPIRYLDEAEMK